MNSEWLIGKGVEGSGHGLMWGSVSTLCEVAKESKETSYDSRRCLDNPHRKQRSVCGGCCQQVQAEYAVCLWHPVFFVCPLKYKYFRHVNLYSSRIKNGKIPKYYALLCNSYAVLAIFYEVVSNFVRLHLRWQDDWSVNDNSVTILGNGRGLIEVRHWPIVTRQQSWMCSR